MGRVSIKRGLIGASVFCVAAVAALLIKTAFDLREFPTGLDLSGTDVVKPRLVDRLGEPLTVTYANRWNLNDNVEFYRIPEFMEQAFVVAEDKRFFSHHGVDHLARLKALYQNLRSMSAVRGASTITEQVVRMLHPRPRTIWSRWLEGIEAKRLEAISSKAEILEFYLNQVPYAAKRRGVVQAARYYFDRDLDTLTRKETLALAVLVRAPGRFDLRRRKVSVEPPIARLAGRLYEQGYITDDELSLVADDELVLAKGREPVRAPHFAGYVYRLVGDLPSALYRPGSKIRTTLDATLQSKVQKILDGRLVDLRSKGVTDGAVLVVDHRAGEVLAWVNGGGFSNDIIGSKIDAVVTPRQPGSTLKPLLYAMAMERGWTAATIIKDSPLAEPVGTGLHTFHNYSRRHYGDLRLRNALGNSLNIPAVRAVDFVGVDRFMEGLRRFGVTSLDKHPDYYGEGVALGNGEVTLYELVGAYSILARGGIGVDLKVILDDVPGAVSGRRLIDGGVASVIGDILSDPEARRLEFGSGNLLRFPTQTAVKTGTSTDYRDAWAVGFSSRYTVGVWMGNLDQSAMKDVTGSTGPALVLRSVFAELSRLAPARPLYISPSLKKVEICMDSGLAANGTCPSTFEWFVPGTEPKAEVTEAVERKRRTPSLARPTRGLRLAMDPRIPDELERFHFALSEGSGAEKVVWYVDGKREGVSSEKDGGYLWPVARGTHLAHAEVWLPGTAEPLSTYKIRFYVR